MRNDIKIGLFGFGCVGKGLWDVLHRTPGLQSEILKICCKNKDKQRPISMEYFTFDKYEILNNPDINVIVELIDNSFEAMEIVREAMKNGKAVVTANKKMISENLEELLFLQDKFSVPLLYEGAVCASIPIIRNLEEYYDNDLLQSIKGIINGTTNFILSKMYEEKIDFKTSLNAAQINGFAESDPSLDIKGLDARSKLHITLAHAFGLSVNPEQILTIGIDKINKFDSNYASEKGKKIKLIAHSVKTSENDIFSLVAPHFIGKEDPLYQVDDVFNGIITESSFAEKNIFIGKGAGAFPTASAVLSDISALSYSYKYEYKKMQQSVNLRHSNNYFVDIYLRFNSFLDIDLNYFDYITESYKSKENQYVIGTIRHNDLIKSGWLDDENISIIINKTIVY
jgi:homoserine dehydrogenase